MAALTFGFVGCSSDDEDDAFDGDIVNFDNSYVFIKYDTDGTTVTGVRHADSATATKSGYTNIANTAAATGTKNGYYYRAFNLLTTHHYDATCTITLTPNSTEGENDGVAGFVFGKSDSEVADADESISSEGGKAYDFGVAAARYSPKDKQIKFYVSWFKGAVVKKNNFQSASNFEDTSGSEIEGTSDANTYTSATGAKEYEAKTAWQETNIELDSDGNAAVKILVKANDDGSYTVSYYKSTDDVSTATAIDTVTIPATVTGFSKRTQTYIGRYAMIKPSKKLNATFEFADISGNPIPADYNEE